ncbi:MAG: hypothetical protein LBU88_08600 [Treponema sp.]|jgi:hypothetical protein|nr:hypothetical protein [Treponema sp.]
MRINNLEAAFNEQIEQHTALILTVFEQELTTTKNELEQDISDRFARTDNQIRRINTIYSRILAEQQKRTLDSMYSESGLIEIERNAARLFLEGKYADSSSQYLIVSNEQPENLNARFYYLYALFLNNKMDRGNYRQIREGFRLLERNGFYRTEMRSVLEHIDMEEKDF